MGSTVTLFNEESKYHSVFLAGITNNTKQISMSVGSAIEKIVLYIHTLHITSHLRFKLN